MFYLVHKLYLIFLSPVMLNERKLIIHGMMRLVYLPNFRLQRGLMSHSVSLQPNSTNRHISFQSLCPTRSFPCIPVGCTPVQDWKVVLYIGGELWLIRIKHQLVNQFLILIVGFNML